MGKGDGILTKSFSARLKCGEYQGPTLVSPPQANQPEEFEKASVTAARQGLQHSSPRSRRNSGSPVREPWVSGENDSSPGGATQLSDTPFCRRQIRSRLKS